MPAFFQALLHAILHAAKESLLLLPFLFLTYLLMEFLEHKAGEKTNRAVARAGRAGPLLGGLLGSVPQCGFAAVAAELYAGRVITLGTLFSVFFTVSDEMLPVMIASGAPAPVILKFLLTKALFGILFGAFVDLTIRLFGKKEEHTQHHHVSEMCESGHCHCEEKGILLSSLHHTVPVFLFLFLLSVLLNLGIELIGESTISAFLLSRPALSSLLSALVGMIPNCASSILLTELYLSGVLSGGAALAGLLSGTGVGALVLLRTNRPMWQSLLLLFVLFLTGFFVGLLVDMTPLAALFAV